MDQEQQNDDYGYGYEELETNNIQGISACTYHTCKNLDEEHDINI